MFIFQDALLKENTLETVMNLKTLLKQSAIFYDIVSLHQVYLQRCISISLPPNHKFLQQSDFR